MAQELTGTQGVQPAAAGVSWQGDILHAAEQGKTFAASLGFPDPHCEEIALVATELASNLIRHASGGTIHFLPIGGEGRQGIEIRSVDNGPGIPAAIRDRIFYPLVSGREGGTGLGLTLAQTFIQHHHGVIEVESQPGRT